LLIWSRNTEININKQIRAGVIFCSFSNGYFGKNQNFDLSGRDSECIDRENPHLCVFPLSKALRAFEIHPFVALSNDKGFRSLRRATNAARVGLAVAFEAKSDAKAFNGLRRCQFSIPDKFQFV
jgi:hypothetical protein